VTARTDLAPVYRMLAVPWLAWLTFLAFPVVLAIGIPAIMQPLVAQFRESARSTRMFEVDQELSPVSVCAFFWGLSLAAAVAALVFPRWLQRRQALAARVRTTASRSPSGWSYRQAGAEVELMDAASLKRVRDAYYARLGFAALLLAPLVAGSALYGVTIIGSYGISHSCRSFAHPGEYLPPLLLAALGTLLHAPTISLVFGRLAAPLYSGRLQLRPDADVAPIHGRP
jgi:hypothetical protein